MLPDPIELSLKKRKALGNVTQVVSETPTKRKSISLEAVTKLRLKGTIPIL
jgi:hypothetical protein